MQPKEIILKWVEAFNRGNANEMADFYTDNAINHQVTQDPVEGKERIREMFAREFSQADMVCIAEAIYEDGQTAILEWKDPLGLRGCGFFTFDGDKIAFQRGYWDKLSFLRIHKLPIPKE